MPKDEKIARLPIPDRFRDIEQVLGQASQEDLEDVIVLGNSTNGGFVLLTGRADGTDFTEAEIVFMLERVKHFIFNPDNYEKTR